MANDMKPVDALEMTYAARVLFGGGMPVFDAHNHLVRAEEA